MAYNLGGLHAGLVMFLIVSLIAQIIIRYNEVDTVCFSAFLLVGVLAISVFAYPAYRHKQKHHDYFEYSHRFIGWLLAVVVIVQIVYTTVVTNGDLWRSASTYLLVCSVFLVTWPWITMKKVTMDIDAPSKMVTTLTTAQSTAFACAGTTGRVSFGFASHYHSFAILNALTGDKGTTFTDTIIKHKDLIMVDMTLPSSVDNPCEPLSDEILYSSATTPTAQLAAMGEGTNSDQHENLERKQSIAELTIAYLEAEDNAADTAAAQNVKIDVPCVELKQGNKIFPAISFCPTGTVALVNEEQAEDAVPIPPPGKKNVPICQSSHWQQLRYTKQTQCSLSLVLNQLMISHMRSGSVASRRTVPRGIVKDDTS
ncbi:hypothetical protein SARC_00394 [Sphaeroforma arctica JP610]|uniref:Uncharacterized protein n=1 Tax=Sphaeroforma arctica JP610 TaxID=667725 RepID=A0A0L0GF65_9EUKA|nr:hypothetical protein SARC_00394 [Sphaeroforma arctica JP610]KNC87509.1 hypothetical protein SARC_00394 [Sphaeroforma arctica JP610]|eukprot:XP_014161411.1 hypothetical protein SARC_00394 [Sphaeroforma arctica JP610]